MAWAIVKGEKHAVRVTQDLTDNFAVEVFPQPPEGTRKVSEPYKPWPVPLIMKVLAKTEADALMCALEHLKSLGRIEDFHVEESEKPPPPPPPKVPVPPAPAAS